MFSARFCGSEGYGFFSVVGSDLVCEMAEDSESREEEEWLQLSIGRQDLGKNNGPGSGLVELDLMPSSSSSSHSQMRPKFRPPRPVVNFGPRPDFVVVAPPRRPHSGVWFMLQASHNQDGRMTIRVVIKYLVKKLSLDNESEIEIRCKGQRLLPMLTLEHVRDNIWSRPRDFITLIPNSSTIHHIMVLHYARSDPSN